MLSEMAIYFKKSCLVTLVLVLRFIYVQNQDARTELLEDKSLKKPFGDDRIADIINLTSYGIKYKDVENSRNFTAPGRRISKIKCLEYIWDTIKKERYMRSQLICNGRVVGGGGRPAQYGEFSHMGAVGWSSLGYGKDRWVYKCGATLISDKFLITAAHCSRLPRHDSSVYNHVPEVVKLGDKFIQSRNYLDCMNYNSYTPEYETIGSWVDDFNIASQIIRIDKFIKHPEYVSPRHYYDIALIELQERVDFGPLIRPACLWNSLDTSEFGNVAFSGWGEISPFSGVMSDELQVGDIGIIENRNCDLLLRKKHNRKWRGLSDHQLCAGVLSGSVDTCRGDSGGPLQAKVNISLRWPVYHLIGVTSFGYGCMRTNMPGIYVRVASFIDWIESRVWPETE